jgi:hypothetical protein
MKKQIAFESAPPEFARSNDSAREQAGAIKAKMTPMLNYLL